MLEIDYSLIPLSRQDQLVVDLAVTEELKSGKVPKLEKSEFGRVVILNPDPVQTVHHVPDELRSNFRRTMIHTSEGHIDLRADRLLDEITASDENLAILIIELKTRFTHLNEFLGYLPALRQRYPDLGVMINTDMTTALAKLAEIMEARGSPLQLIYPDARGVIEIEQSSELSMVVSDTVEPVTFSVPFFSQIRLVSEDGKKNQAYNLDTLRRLHSQYGHGEAKEVDLGGGRKERMVVLDLPMRLIKDFQFRQDRGLDFHGVIRAGGKVLSRNFEKEKLEFRWIPMQSILEFIRKGPGEEEQKASVAKSTILRVNCFYGKTSFIMRSTADQISLEDVKTVAFGKLEATSAEGVAPTISFDRLVLPSSELTESDPLQNAVKDFIYGRKIRNAAERTRKLEIYTSRLKVGSVGPMAAQTLKIFRRFGLERLIDKESFHYLCDLPQQLPTYQETAGRFSENFRNLLASMRKIAEVSPSDPIRVDDFMHNLPVTLEWIDDERLTFQKADAKELDVVYNEMHSLVSFIGHEFRRHFDIEEKETGFFNKIQDCQNAGLMAKWMADFKRGAYGPLMKEGTHPDVVFFGTPGDKKENDKSFFFPSLACSELFNDERARNIYAATDFGFSIFLEAQMALADHYYREQAQEDAALGDFSSYFDIKIRESNQELENLHNDLKSLDSIDSPGFMKMLQEEEEAYHDRYRDFIQSLDKTIQHHRKEAGAFWELIEQFKHLMQLGDEPSFAWMAGEEPDASVFDQDFVVAMHVIGQKKHNEINELFSKAVEGFQERIEAMSYAMEDLRQAYGLHQEWQTSQGGHFLNSQKRALHGKAAEKLPRMKRISKNDLEAHQHRVRVQKDSINTDFKLAESRVAQHQKKNEMTLKSMSEVVERMAGSFLEMSEPKEDEEPAETKKHFDAYQSRLEKVIGSIGSLGTKIIKGMSYLEKIQAQKNRLATQGFSLQLESAILQAAAGGPQRLPAPPKREEVESQAADAARKKESFVKQKEKAGAFLEEIQRIPESFSETFRQMEGILADYGEFNGSMLRMVKLSARKARLRQSHQALTERQKLMEAELADLPTRVREKFMPARKRLLLNLFIPEAEKKIGYFKRAKALLNEINHIHHERLKSLYLDRAVFRRFSSSQFVRGANIGMDTQAAQGRGLHNIHPAVNQLNRHLHYNLSKQHPAKGQRAKLKHLKHMDTHTLLEFAKQQSVADQGAYDYLVLPASLDIAEAVNLMNKKDRHNKGVPRLVMIYVSKFQKAAIQENKELREAYFMAQKHNVIVNIDGHSIVDNPQAIGLRLLHETLGSTFDTAEVVEEMEDDDKKVAFRV